MKMRERRASHRVSWLEPLWSSDRWLRRRLRRMGVRENGNG
jgi:hypothetical protein